MAVPANLTNYRFPKYILLAAIATIVAGCSGGSGSSALNFITAQAVDGYIVNGQVYCDAMANGVTTQGGEFQCPTDSQVMRVLGGNDVGFTTDATTAGIPFYGELAGPTTLDFITPLTTLAYHMSTSSDGYDASKWDESLATVRQGLNIQSPDITASPVTNIELVRFNSSIHQVIDSFTLTQTDYPLVASSFANLLEAQASQGAVLDLESGLAQTMSLLNDRLQQENNSLYQSEAQIINSTEMVQAVNSQVFQAETPVAVGQVVSGIDSSDSPVALILDRSNTIVSLSTYFSSIQSNLSIDDFENSEKLNDQFTTQIGDNLDTIQINKNAFSVEADLFEEPISIGVSIISTDTGDSRSLQMVTDDALLSASAGDPNSIVLSFPESAVMHLSGVGSNGISTETSVEIAGKQVYTTNNSHLDVSTRNARRELDQLGFTDILDSSGNFQLTIVFGGIKIRQTSASGTEDARRYSVRTSDNSVTGTGFRGFVHYTR